MYGGFYGHGDANVHGTAGAPRGGRDSGGRGTGFGGKPAPVAIAPSRVPLGFTGSMRERGVERHSTINIAGGTANGYSLYSLRFDASVLPRLRRLSQTFQRIVYHSLKFTISGKAPTAVGGGFLAVFIPDPDDDNVTLERAASSQGNVPGRWWDEKTVVATVPKSRLYTSPSAELRLFSPGWFYLFVDGSPTSACSLTLEVSWDVTLDTPSLEEAPKGPLSFSPSGPLRFASGAQNLTNSAATIADATKLLEPPIENDTWLKLPFVALVEYSEGSGDTGTLPFRYLWATKGNETVIKLYPRENLGDKTFQENGADVVWQANVTPKCFLVPGDSLEVVTPPKNVTRSRTHNQSSGSRRDSSTSSSSGSETLPRASSRSISNLLQSERQLQRDLRTLMKAFADLMNRKPQETERSSLLERSPLSESIEQLTLPDLPSEPGLEDEH